MPSNRARSAYDCSSLVHWLTDHESAFRISEEEVRDPFTSLKPLGELVFVLRILQQTQATVYPCFQPMIARIWMNCEALDRRPIWKTLLEFSRAHPNNNEVWQIFLHLELLHGKKFRFHAEMTDLLERLSDHEAPLTSALAYTRTLTHTENTELPGLNDLKSLLRSVKTGERLQTSDLYDLTHAIFFASQLGRHDLSKLPIDLDLLAKAIDQAIESALANQWLDLAAELVSCQRLCGFAESVPARTAKDRLYNNLSFDRSRPLKRKNAFCRDTNYFTQYYHLVLTTLLAFNH